MKIVSVSIYPEEGQKHANISGVASYTKNLITHLPNSESDEIYVLCNRIAGKSEAYVENNVNVIRCFDRNFRFVWQIWKELRRIQPDTIHIQQELALYGSIFTAYLLQWLLLALKRYNTIITLHGVVSLRGITKEFIHENNSSLPIWLTKIGFWIIFKPLCVLTGKIIVHEEIFKKILVDEYNVDSEKIEVIPHGVEDLRSMTKEDACRNLTLDSKRDIVLFMGYLTGYKGLDFLIEGFAKYTKVNANAYLIIGSGKHPKLFDDENYLKEYDRIQGKAKELIPENQYQWVGFIDEKDIARYYSVGDVSMYPYTVSMSSSGPMAIAIGYEKPFLASNVFSGIIPEDLLFSRDSESVAWKLQKFFENKGVFLEQIKRLKSARIWSFVSAKTREIYGHKK